MVVSGESGSIPAILDVLGQSGCLRAKWLYSGKVGVFGQNTVVFGQKWLYSGKSGCIQAKWYYLGKVVVFVQSGCFRAKI